MPLPWFKFSRRYINSAYFGNPKYDRMYLWFASEAAQTEHTILTGNRDLRVLPGQLLTGRLRACEILGITEMEWRNRLKTLVKNQLIAVKPTNRYTVITLIDPDTYEWQKVIYSRKGTSKSGEKEPSKNQQETTTIEDQDLKLKKTACARACGEESGMRADEVGPSSVDGFEASFSEHKDAVLAVWRKEREAVGLVYVRSPRNDRAAVSAAAMIEAGDWSIELIERAAKALMASPERQNYTLAGLIENLELWVNGGPNYERSKNAKTTGSPASQPRPPAGSRLREMAIAQGMDPDVV